MQGVFRRKRGKRPLFLHQALPGACKPQQTADSHGKSQQAKDTFPIPGYGGQDDSQNLSRRKGGQAPKKGRAVVQNCVQFCLGAIPADGVVLEVTQSLNAFVSLQVPDVKSQNLKDVEGVMGSFFPAFDTIHMVSPEKIGTLPKQRPKRILRYSSCAMVDSITLPSSRMMAPPRREEICAKGMSSMRFAADRTATSPVPPMLDMHRPAVRPDSTG